MNVVVATSNAGKIREIEEAMQGLGWTLSPLGSLPLPEETGTTYEENAALKACAAAVMLGRPALADDSGIEVEALGGEPGVYSARYGNRDSDVERNVYLLEKLRGQTNRRAKFVSVVILAYPDGHLETYRGELPVAYVASRTRQAYRRDVVHGFVLRGLINAARRAGADPNAIGAEQETAYG